MGWALRKRVRPSRHVALLGTRLPVLLVQLPINVMMLKTAPRPQQLRWARCRASVGEVAARLLALPGGARERTRLRRDCWEAVSRQEGAAGAGHGGKAS